MSGHTADIRHLCQFRNRRVHQDIQTSESGRQHLAGFGANLANAQRIDQPTDVLLLTGFDRRQELGSNGGTGNPETLDFLQCQIVNIRRRMNQALANQPIHNGGTKPLNVHGIPADKMGDIPAQLRGAFGAGTAQKRPIRILFHPGAAGGTALRQVIGGSTLRAFGKVNFQNLRNDLPRFPNQNRITNPNIPGRDKILIVQRGVGHGCSRQPHWAYHSLGRQNAGASNLNNNVLDNRGLDFRRILVGGGPAGEFRGGSQMLPLPKIIHLDDGAIDIADQLVPVFIDGQHLFVDILR